MPRPQGLSGGRSLIHRLRATTGGRAAAAAGAVLCERPTFGRGSKVYDFDARCFHDPNRCWHPEIIDGVVSKDSLTMVERRAV